MSNTPVFNTYQVFDIDVNKVYENANWLQTIFDDINKKTLPEKLSYKLGQTTGSVKNFFSKKQTKAGVLLGYWAGDTFVTVALIIMGASAAAIAVATTLLIIHTYATFSVVNEIL